jgi:hypothetical protein
MKGFGTIKPKKRTATYWVARYLREDEDEPISVAKQTIEYIPGQNKERLMLAHCHEIFRTSPDVWEVLVHQGVDSVPESGDQIVARLSREHFNGCEELTI